ncbi:MAG: hypothetical protein R3D84_12110 [Paracoccaceae bacterium]
MRASAAALIAALAGATPAAAGDVEIVRLCVATTTMVKEFSSALDAARAGDMTVAQVKYNSAVNRYYEDWMVFSIVMGQHARTLLNTETRMNAVLEAVEACVVGKPCQADRSTAQADFVWSNLPAACQQDYQEGL